MARLVHPRLLVVLLVVAASGCGSVAGTIKYPDYPRGAAIAVSAETTPASTMPAGAHLVEGSQVWIFGKTGATTVSAVLGGPLGVLVGAQIDRARNLAAVGEGESALSRRFDATLRDALGRHQGGGSESIAIRQSADANAADVTLLPEANLILRDDGRLHTSFRVAARIRGVPEVGEATRTYFYNGDPSRPLEGPETWWADGGKAFAAAAERAMDALAATIVRDMRGTYRAQISADPMRIVDWTPVSDPSTRVSGALLDETADHLVVVPMFRNVTPMRALVLVIHKSIVNLQGTRDMAVADTGITRP